MNRPKILLLSDDLMEKSGIATMSRKFVENLCGDFDWVQLGAAKTHRLHGRITDLSEAVKEKTGKDNVYVKVYHHTGYGNAAVLREMIALEKPDIILHFTDPRFWEWLYLMEHEIRCDYGIPIAYYNIWDAPPIPYWNRKFYRSCDLIMNISKQTHQLVKGALQTQYQDLDDDYSAPLQLHEKTAITYVPHGIDPNEFFPIEDGDEGYRKFKENFYKTHPNAKFIVFWNNRNMARKRPADLMEAFTMFCGDEGIKSEECLLLMHTDPYDPNGSDLIQVRKFLQKRSEKQIPIAFSNGTVSTATLNYMYNIANVVVNVAANEGFGLSNVEALMAGTPVICTVTGGLQDHCGFEDGQGKLIQLTVDLPSNHKGRHGQKSGAWSFPLFPKVSALQGSQATPYIYYDLVPNEAIASALCNVYESQGARLESVGLLGREFVKEHFSVDVMGSRMRKALLKLHQEWKPKSKFKVVNVMNHLNENK